MKSLIVVLWIVLPVVVLADDLYLKNGYVYHNVLALDTLNGQIKVRMSDGTKWFPLTSVARIVNAPYYEGRETTIKQYDPELMVYGDLFEQPRERKIVRRTQSNLKLLPITLISGAIAWDMFAQASDISDQIELYNRLGVSTSALESERSRKQIIGIGCVVIGVVNLFLALEQVEVETTGDRLTVSYKF